MEERQVAESAHCCQQSSVSGTRRYTEKHLLDVGTGCLHSSLMSGGSCDVQIDTLVEVYSIQSHYFVLIGENDQLWSFSQCTISPLTGKFT